MRSAFGRAVVVACAVVMALGSAAGAAAAKPRPPVLTFSPPLQLRAGSRWWGGLADVHAGQYRRSGHRQAAGDADRAAAFTVTGDTCTGISLRWRHLYGHGAVRACQHGCGPRR